MIQNNQELEATLTRIRHFQKQIEKLKVFETIPLDYKLSAGDFLSKINRMNLEVKEYLSILCRRESYARTKSRTYQ